MCWHLGVGMQRKPVDTGTAGARECGAFPFIPKARANPAHRLPGPLAKGDALRDGGGQGAREHGCFAAQRIILGGHGGVAAGAWWYEISSNQMLALRCAKYNGTFHRVFTRSQQQKSDA